MHKSSILLFKGVKKVYSKIAGTKELTSPESEQNPDSCAEIILDTLLNNKPAMIARLGANEMNCVANYIGVLGGKNIIGYIKGETPPWWWDEARINQLHIGAGFFPKTISSVEAFCKLMLDDISYIDVLGSWLSDERYIKLQLQYSKKVKLIFLDPFWAKQPWTKALENKTVLIVHPFAETIQYQYNKRELLFNNNVLPTFNLKTIKAVQSVAGNKTEFNDWFKALDFMKSEIEKKEFDMCLIGAGAYGLPLAAHVKRMGKKGIHLGGSLQLLFGIKGKRWENPMQGKSDGVNYLSLFNEHWVRLVKMKSQRTHIKLKVILIGD